MFIGQSLPFFPTNPSAAVLSWLAPDRTPIIVAHRGASAVEPENTLAAFRRAIEDGADAVELDVRLSSDGELVVFHDSTLHRITGRRGFVHEWPLNRLKTLSAGAWFRRRSARERIPTLAEALRVLRGKAAVNIEIKSRPGQSALIVTQCCRLVGDQHLQPAILISSFNRRFVELVKKIDPRSASGLLIHPVRSLLSSPARLARRAGADYVILSGSRLRKKMVLGAHRTGIRVGEYTANTRRRVGKDLRYGVDMIITNDPFRIRKFLPRS